MPHYPITNSSIQLWLDFNGTIPTVIPSCQQRANDYGHLSSPNVTLQNCTDICITESALIDPLLPNNLHVCGLWASIVHHNVSLNPYSDNLVSFTSLGLDHDNQSYVDDVQMSIANAFVAIYFAVGMGTSSISTTTPEDCANKVLFGTVTHISRYAAPCMRKTSLS